jgi:hypothetical protein
MIQYHLGVLLFLCFRVGQECGRSRATQKSTRLDLAKDSGHKSAQQLRHECTLSSAAQWSHSLSTTKPRFEIFYPNAAKQTQW